MKVRRGHGDDKIELMMTPMIDIVFQLLTFFIMTFKVASAEGDFNVKMPLAAPREGMPDPSKLPPMRVRLTAAGNGQLAEIKLNEKNFGTNFDKLRDHIISVIGDARGPGSIQETAEVELDCDFHLKYEYVIQAVTSVSGYLDASGNIVKLVEKVKFAPPRGQG
jgi:biopolymer transport protein ExbD